MRTASETELQTEMIRQADHYWGLARALYPRALGRAERPPIRFDLSGASAGEVQFMRRRGRTLPRLIRFNPAIARTNPRHVGRTVAHEIAHAAAVQAHGRAGSGHGRHWQAIMAAFGQPAERCHDYDLTGIAIRRQRRFRYDCNCTDGQWLTTVRHRRQQRGERRYVCRRCRSPLYFNEDRQDPAGS